VDIVTISKRLGHENADITLRVYAHLFKKDDSKAAAPINAPSIVRVAIGWQTPEISLFVLSEIFAKCLTLLRRKGGRVV
jgi:hypothetical protein